MTFEKVKCNLCKSESLRNFNPGIQHLNLNNEIGVSQCNNCGLLFLNPRPNSNSRQRIFQGETIDGLEDYTTKQANYGSVTNSRKLLFERRVKSISKKFFSKTMGKVLDIGASSGEFLTAAKKYGWDSIGVEPSSYGINELHQKGLEAIQAQAENLPFDDNTFDWVHSNHVFEHLADPLSATKEAYRVLKPDGLIFIEVPNQFDNIQFFRYRLMNKIPVRERNIRSIHHLFFFSKKTLRILLETSGFKEIQILNYYGSKRKGIAGIGSTLVRLVGKLYLGGPFIQAIAKK